MSRLPQINIVAGDGFTHASIGKKLIAVRWHGGDAWYVATVGRAPQDFDNEADATRAFFVAAGITPGGAS